ncbi:hypothetical protein SIN8267_01692 [Sinobacterium norvegicum]|uniref:Alginate export domain-containing protein n=1 Tax=Sinobacterium norvegicum TaxID=1641715 RepID=A0ABM9AEF2_9GAMM|nr:alginate export family protein [Sinobacterium norvegicum]CAH0991583.1 hypothetical protein SIN8267_01692 [Sinobacterium norvegicum]
MKFHLSPIAIAITIASATASNAGKTFADDSFYQAISSGTATIDVRTRYESVDQDGIDNTADALTIRTKLGYKTGDYLGFTGFIEMEDSRTIAGIDDYAPNKSGYPVIADPASTNLNQAYLNYQFTEGLDLRAGRQRIILDNARFVGNVGWRQNEQTFDAVKASYGANNLTVDAVWISQVKTITDGTLNTNHALFNASYQLANIGKLTGYFYGLDNQDDSNDNATNSDTYGVRFAGSMALNDSIKLIYNAEYANQKTDVDNYNADYILAEIGADFSLFSIKAGYELLGSDDASYGFQTPLATKHAFNGWADKFLSTPTGGLQDSYIQASTKVAGMKLAAIYHQYDADQAFNCGGSDQCDSLGDEINLLLVKPLAKKYKVGVKYAAYSATDFATDTDKVWLWGEMKF